MTSAKKIAVIVATFNRPVTKLLEEGCVKELEVLGYQKSDLEIVYVPGCTEIPLVAQHLIVQQSFQGIIALGAVIKGETAHFEYVCKAVQEGIMRVMLDTSTPIIMGVLTTNNAEQAYLRADPLQKNNGKYYAQSLLKLLSLTS